VKGNEMPFGTYMTMKIRTGSMNAKFHVKIASIYSENDSQL